MKLIQKAYACVCVCVRSLAPFPVTSFLVVLCPTNLQSERCLTYSGRLGGDEHHEQVSIGHW